jgi:segregation and condensation protein B
MTIDQQIEAILFAGARAMPIKKLAELIGVETADIQDALGVLRRRLDEGGSAVMLQTNGPQVELVTRPEATEAVSKVVQDEAAGELSRPSLETLTILAYSGPLTRPEIEQIRGVQSSMILRNLMLRGLVEEREESRLGMPTFAVTLEFLNHLGVPSVSSLPEYEKLHGHSAIADVLEHLAEKTPEPSSPSLSV